MATNCAISCMSKVKCLFLVGLICIAGYLAYICYCHRYLPAAYLQAILVDGKTIEMSSVSFSGSGKTFVVTSESDLAYLSRQMRGAQFVGYVPKTSGAHITAEIAFSDGGHIAIGALLPDDLKGFNVSPDYFTSFGDPVYYWIDFDDSMPKGLLAIISSLK